jgi:AcrR family transcriptional regulator
MWNAARNHRDSTREFHILKTGRINQKARTRDALIAAAHQLRARGAIPTVEEASIGRTTAYRYFPNSRALLAAIFPEIEMSSLLGVNPPDDPLARLEILAENLTRRIVEPEYRAPAAARAGRRTCRRREFAAPGGQANRMG